MKLKSFIDSIIHQDQDYLILNKWSGISTLSDRNDEKCLLDLAREHFADIQVCHRLDKHTSGLLVFAKNQASYRNLALQFQDRLVKKIYHALVEGRHAFKDKIIDLPILQGRRGHVRVSHASGKAAQTVVNTLKQFNAHSLVQCMPITGRTHQIRIHLSAVNAPIAGDADYGGHELFLSNIKRHYNQNKSAVERPLMSRAALHARSLRFKTVSQEDVEFEAEYPKDFRATLRQLEKVTSSSTSWY
ncbi:MAG: RNA pseudouridine synthase [Cyclobacteriaceae bacterium]|nr:MAG: RNA pseudouridine synthase [Cyclobacteriaceae bacterium]